MEWRNVEVSQCKRRQLLRHLYLYHTRAADFTICPLGADAKASEASRRRCLPQASRGASDSAALATQDYRPSL